MSRASKLISKLEKYVDPASGRDLTSEIDPDSVVSAFQDALDKHNIEGISVLSADVDEEGVTVTFGDEDSEEMAVLFTQDDEEGAVAFILDDDPDGEISDDIDSIDLDPLTPPMRDTEMGQFIDLNDLYWMNKSTLLSIFQAGEIEAETQPKVFHSEKDAFGFTHTSLISKNALQGESLQEKKFKTVVRGGKKVRLPVVRRRRKRRLTPKQKAGLKKAAQKRRQKKGQISRKLKRSLKVRKRLGVKKGKRGSRKKFRVKG